MKKIIFMLTVALLSTVGVQAQLIKKESVISEAYEAGKVPVVNGKVTFETSISAKGLTAKEVEERVNGWIAKRYVKPTVISVKRFDSEKPGTTIIKGEEYIVFKNTFFVLSRARMYYFLTLTAEDGSCNFHLSRITYWYDDEDEKGGIKMIAEDWITDDNAFDKKGKMKKFEGKFRRKTIDLKEQLINELTQALNE
ncbi:MAG: DUF4468 domain-containing protein [Bacteroidaceae bacterium]|nr:DUF4468 domain-containing protein [Bacteroidaceae bacterium]